MGTTFIKLQVKGNVEKLPADFYEIIEKNRKLPSKISELITGKSYVVDDIGMSDSTVITYENMVLKIENYLVNIEKAEPGTFGPGGFENPAKLLDWLENNRPLEEPVLSHGDFCLPNVFIDNGKISGFIDLGDAGIGDKWRDIAPCYRSLKHNFDGTFGGKVYENFSADILFEKLGIEPNPEKLRYYILLDELF